MVSSLVGGSQPICHTALCVVATGEMKCLLGKTLRGVRPALEGQADRCMEAPTTDRAYFRVQRFADLVMGECIRTVAARPDEPGAGRCQQKPFDVFGVLIFDRRQEYCLKRSAND